MITGHTIIITINTLDKSETGAPKEVGVVTFLFQDNNINHNSTSRNL